MAPIAPVTRPTDADRMRVRAVTALAGEIIATYWPMRTFVHHNPLHSLESLPFREAVSIAQDRLGGSGYLPASLYREALQSGRIALHHLERALEGALERLPAGGPVRMGDRKVSRAEVLRVHLSTGISAPSPEVLEALLHLDPERPLTLQLARLLSGEPPTGASSSPPSRDSGTRTPFSGGALPLSSWCDRTLSTELVSSINREMVKWCEAFLDEDHASWQMPGRERGFYGAWRRLAPLEWSLGKERKRISLLPDAPEDALLVLLDSMGIPEPLHQEYLSHHLAALPGWPAFIKWRALQDDYPYQQTYPVDLLQYLAVRLWYESREVETACRSLLGIGGTYEAIKTWHSGANPGAGTADERRKEETIALSEAWRLTRLSRALAIPGEDLLSSSPAELRTLLSWLDAFPESEHGPIWLEAYEAGYREGLIRTIVPSPPQESSTPPPSDDPTVPDPVRPQGQAVFCIDVRSEPFRRHMESVGDYETYGFAGFFSVFIRYRALESDQETDQFPVIMKGRNAVREVLRSYHGGLSGRHQSGRRILHAGHALLHDLKENVVTPYVAVESLGWFYGIPLIGKTILPVLHNRLAAFLRSLFVPSVSTALTVDKLSRKEVEEMLAAEQRSVIRRALQEHYGDRDLNLSLERLEFLRQRALDMIPSHQPQRPHPAALTLSEEAVFVERLRERYRITHGWSFARMERMTRIGFTLNEQVQTVETALRMMGLIRNFARLVLFCGHGSTSENNPFESALDCGACGGNSGKPNARVLATMANRAPVRERLAQKGLVIPADTVFIAGEHDTTTDRVTLFDLEDIPHTHSSDLLRLTEDLRKTGLRTSRERCGRFPELPSPLSPSQAEREVRRRSMDWSQIRPEWGLSGNASFIIGRRALTRRVDLSGRAFLHSYDYRDDPRGVLLEGIMTGPQVVGEWISMEHYFSTVDNAVFGSGSKIYHNVVGRFGIMAGPQGDLLTGLARQTVMDRGRPFHEPMRLQTLIEAPCERIMEIIRRHTVLQQFYDNEWVHLLALDPDGAVHAYQPGGRWVPTGAGGLPSTSFEKEMPQ